MMFKQQTERTEGDISGDNKNQRSYIERTEILEAQFRSSTLWTEASKPFDRDAQEKSWTFEKCVCNAEILQKCSSKCDSVSQSTRVKIKPSDTLRGTGLNIQVTS